MIVPLKDKKPKIDPSVFITEGVYIIGDVTIGKDCSIWYNSVLRGDVNYIRIGERTNIQDGSIIHVTHKVSPCIIGSNVTVGHGAIIHAAVVEDYCLIGMGATILDRARIGKYSLIAAGSLVLEDTVIPEGALAAGVPARVKRMLTPEERIGIEESAQHYIDYVKMYDRKPING